MKIKETIIMGKFVCLLTIPTIKAQGKISETNYEGHHKECSKKHSIENFKQKIKTQKLLS